MYKHRVDYYDYPTVFYSIHTCNKLHIETVSHVRNHTSGDLEGFMLRVNEHWETHMGASSHVRKTNVGRGSRIGKHIRAR